MKKILIFSAIAFISILSLFAFCVGVGNLIDYGFTVKGITKGILLFLPISILIGIALTIKVKI